MKTKHSGIALAWLAATLLLTACGGGGGSSTGNGATYSLSGQVQKGPFSIGSQVTVNELDASLNPTGKVYNVQTSDDLGNFAVSSKIGTNLVEIVGDGFYMDELTGQLAASRIQLRAVADLSVNATPTVNILTSLQEQRLKTLLSQGKTYTAANTQSQTEVLAVFGIDSTKINSLATLYSMKINGTTDADSVLLATSVILSKMATNAAVTNGTTQPAELSSYISTIAAQIASAGTITDAAITSAKNLAATQIDLVAVRTNVETYYANKGVTIVAPKFEEWVDKSGSGILPQRLVPVTGLTFTDVTGASPAQLITSNVITVAGLGAGIVAPVTVNIGTTIIKNNVAVTGTSSTAQDGDTIAMRVTSLGGGLTNTSTISVGSTSATWRVTSKPYISITSVIDPVVGGNAYTPVQDPINTNVIYAGTYNKGLYKSIDAGNTWSLSSGLPSTSTITSLTIDPVTTSTLYAIVYSGSWGLYKTTDSGANWVAINNGLPAIGYPLFLSNVAINPSSPNVLYIGSLSQGGGPGIIYSSTNGGTSWSQISNTPSGVGSLAVDPTTPTTIYAATANDIGYRSIDGGLTWTGLVIGSINSGVIPTQFVFPNGSPSLILAATNGGAYRSNDGGVNWVNSLTGSQIYSFAVDKNNPAVIFAGGQSGGISAPVYLSLDSGQSWTLFGNILTPSSILFGLVFDPITNKIIASADHLYAYTLPAGYLP